VVPLQLHRALVASRISLAGGISTSYLQGSQRSDAMRDNEPAMYPHFDACGPFSFQARRDFKCMSIEI